jgi:arsenate reductase
MYNSARSQMAEGLLKALAGDRFTVESAGIIPCRVNPIIVEAMKEIGIDISRNRSQNVLDVLKQGKKIDYLITVCDDEQAAKCPTFPDGCRRLHWSTFDPVKDHGSHDIKLERTRKIRDELKIKILDWLKTFDHQ